jgi:hypothetical protein
LSLVGFLKTVLFEPLEDEICHRLFITRRRGDASHGDRKIHKLLFIDELQYVFLLSGV